MKAFGLLLILMSLAGSAFGVAVAAPEIDGSTAVSAVALVAGGLLVLRSRRK